MMFLLPPVLSQPGGSITYLFLSLCLCMALDSDQRKNCIVYYYSSICCLQEAIIVAFLSQDVSR